MAANRRLAMPAQTTTPSNMRVSSAAAWVLDQRIGYAGWVGADTNSLPAQWQVMELEFVPDDDKQSSNIQAAPKSHEIHEVIRREGEDDLGRHKGAVAWSGLAAGLSMGFSFLTMAILRSALPDSPWSVLISALGYTIGFLIVVLGKQQLFTESTLTAVLPVLSNRSVAAIPELLLYWVVVLATNLVGTVLFAGLICHEQLFSPAVWTALNGVADEAMQDPFWPMLVKAVLAGWLIALMIWLLPSAGSAKVLIIVILTYVVAVGHFSHSIAGSVESAFSVMTGHHSPLAYFTHFFIPTLLGNTFGGVALVALLNHAPLRVEEG